MTKGSDGYYRLKGMYGDYLDFNASGEVQNSTGVHSYFLIESAGDGMFRLKWKGNVTYCLDGKATETSGTENGDIIQRQFINLTKESQKWYFIEAEEEDIAASEVVSKSTTSLGSGKIYYPITNNGSWRCVLDNTSGTYGNVVGKSISRGSMTQKWMLVKEGSEAGIYTLRAMIDIRQALAVKGGSSAAGAQLVTTRYAVGETTQMFKLVKTSGGQYVLYSRPSNYTLAVCAPAASGGNVTQQSYSPTDSRMNWYLVEASELDGEVLSSSAYYMSEGNLMMSATDGRGKITTMGYDTSKGLLTTVTDANKNSTKYTYDAGNDRVTKVQRGDVYNEYTYKNDRLNKIKANEGKVQYAFWYNTLGQRTSTLVGNGSTWRTLATNSYNEGNLLSKVAYGNDQSVNYAYDTLDRVSSKWYNEENQRFSLGRIP